MAQAEVLSHWYQLVAGATNSTQDFYLAVERHLQLAKVPQIKRNRVERRERGLLSATREYLRVTWGEYTFDVCAAPFGSGFFVSWWLVTHPTCLQRLTTLLLWLLFWPIMGLLHLCKLIGRPKTYYEIDTELMFQSVVHSAVAAATEELILASGARPLSDLERKPVMGEFLGRVG
jgi:hypothetical protein